MTKRLTARLVRGRLGVPPPAPRRRGARRRRRRELAGVLARRVLAEGRAGRRRTPRGRARSSGTAIVGDVVVLAVELVEGLARPSAHRPQTARCHGIFLSAAAALPRRCRPRSCRRACPRHRWQPSWPCRKTHCSLPGSGRPRGGRAATLTTYRTRPRPRRRGGRRLDRLRQDRAVARPGRALHGEVVSTDAMRVYRGMDIGAAKRCRRPERRGIAPPPRRRRSTTRRRSRSSRPGRAWWSPSSATAAGCRCWWAARRWPPRARSWTTSSSPRPTRTYAVGSAELERIGPAALFERLREQDGGDDAPENDRRTVRALGSSPSPVGPTPPASRCWSTPTRTVQIGVDIDRPTLDARIARRVDLMFEQGLRRGAPPAGPGPGRRSHRVPRDPATARSRRTSTAS